MTERPQFLKMLAEEDRRAGAPVRVEMALRARVRRRKGGAAAWLPAWPAWTAAAAACAAMFAVLVLRPSQEARLPEPARFAPDVPEMAYQIPERVQAFDEYGKPVAQAAATAHPARALPTQERRFYSLAYAPPELLANGKVVRVRVPRAALLSFGLPLDAYRPTAGKIDADVIFTEDGIARAIRFVSP